MSIQIVGHEEDIRCPRCGHFSKFIEHETLLSMYVCRSCNNIVQLPAPTSAEKKHNRRKQKKDSLQQEKRVATRLKLKHHGDSGASWHQKGDMASRPTDRRAGGFEFVVSEKSTGKKSFSLKTTDLNEMASWAKGRIALMVLSFTSQNEDYAILKLDDLERLLHAAEVITGSGDG